MLMASMEWAWKQSNFSIRFHDRCLPITLMFVFSMHVRMLDSSIKLVRSSPASKRKPKNTTPQWYLSSDIFFSICQRWLWCLLFSWRWIVWVDDHCSMKHNSWSINMNCIICLHLSCTVSMLSARTTLDTSIEGRYLWDELGLRIWKQSYPWSKWVNGWIAFVVVALLSAARNRRNKQLVENIHQRMNKLFPRLPDLITSATVLLANLYGSTGEMDKASNIRSELSRSGAKKKPGLSWTAVNGELYVSLWKVDTKVVESEQRELIVVV